MNFHPEIVRQVAEELATGATARAQGNAVILESRSGSTQTVVCGYDGVDAQAFLDAATAAAASPDLDSFRVDYAARQAKVAATNKAMVLHQRNRWLAQTDPYVLPDASLPADMPADVLSVLTAEGTPSVQDQIKTWRQALRDYPATVTDWTAPPPLPAAPQITLASGRALIIVT